MVSAEFLNFTPSKREILEYLKSEGERSLLELSIYLQKTKMGILKNLKPLEEKKLVQRNLRSQLDDEGRKKPGRPVAYFQLGSKAHQMLTKASTQLSCSFIEFIAKNMGQDGVIAAFDTRSQEVFEIYSKSVTSHDFDERIKQFKQIRDQDGYMVQLKVIANGYEFIEYNCPIIAVADKYSEACKSEKKLFEKLMRTNVEISHRIVNKSDTCKFIFSRPSIE